MKGNQCNKVVTRCCFACKCTGRMVLLKEAIRPGLTQNMTFVDSIDESQKNHTDSDLDDDANGDNDDDLKQ